MCKGKELTYQNRVKIEYLYNHEHLNASKIADILCYNRSTIYRELSHGFFMHLNTDYTEVKQYSADRGQQYHDFNVSARGKSLKIENDYALLHFIENLIINCKYSPEACVLFINSRPLPFKTHISYKTIYRYIDNNIFARVRRKHLPCREKNKRTRQEKTIIVDPSKTSIEERPHYINDRSSFGHWEMDSIIGKRESGETLVLFTERKTNYEFIFRSPNKTCDATVNIINSLEKTFGNRFPKIFQSITCDNGCEFSDQSKLEKSVLTSKKRTSVYYCHPYSSWERGSNEKQNQMVRRFIAKSTKIESYSDQYIKDTEQWLNSYPRKKYNGQTAQQMFDYELSLLDDFSIS